MPGHSRRARAITTSASSARAVDASARTTAMVATVATSVVIAVAAAVSTNWTRSMIALVSLASAAVVAAIVDAGAHRSRTASAEQRQEAFFNAMLDATLDPMLITDGECRVMQMNEAGRTLFGEAAIGRRCADVLALEVAGHPVEAGRGCPVARRAGTPSGWLDALHFRPDGERLPVQVTARAVSGPEGITNYVHTMRDVSELRLADEAKTLFLATSSHELKTPLTVIRGFLETIDRPDANAELQATAIRIMRQRADELTDIVDRILLASEIDAGHLDLRLRPTNVAAIARDRVEALAAATGRNITLDAHGDQAGVGDPTALATVLDHLLDNACKYSASSRPIVVTVTPGEGAVVIAVEDRGTGMTPDQTDHCFEKFWRAGAASARRPAGSGLGLYIVKSIVTSMGGSITVDSEPDVGTRFIIRLEASDQPASESPPSDASNTAASSRSEATPLRQT